VARAIARHLLNHYQQIVQEDVGALRVISTDANELTALDFAVILGHYDIEHVLIVTF
jgi:hypothetical protein